MLHPTFKVQLPLLARLFKEHKIKNAYAFGSVVSDKFTDESDIDILINFGRAWNLWKKEKYGGIYMIN